MSAIEIQCKKMNKTFLGVIDENPLGAALMLGNLYRSFKKADDDQENLLKATLVNVKDKLTPKLIQRVWRTIIHLSSADLKIMSETNKKTLHQFKHEMLCDIDFFKHFSVDSLVRTGQEIEFYRETLVALIRKDLLDRKKRDPFDHSSFKYKLLKGGGPEQNFRYLSKYIKRCDSLPLESIISLGIHDSEIANLILIDFNDSKIHFEAGYRFAKTHPDLRKTIANEWKNYLHTMPLNAKEKAFIEKKLPKLKKQYAEFKKVSLDSRIRRNNHPQSSSLQGSSLIGKLGIASLSGLGLSYGLSYALSKLGFSLLIPASAVVIPPTLGATFCISYFSRRQAPSQGVSKEAIIAHKTKKLKP